MSYSVLGYYNRRNMGDDALLYGAKHLLREKAAEFVSEPPQKLSKVILGGGDVIKDFYLKSVEPTAPLKILGAGLGYESEIEKLKAFNVEKAYFRNVRDVDVARQNGINSEYIPDLAFGLKVPNWEVDWDRSLSPSDFNRSGKKIAGVMVVDDMSYSLAQQNQAHAHYASYLKHELAVFLQDISQYYTIVFIPMSSSQYGRDIKTVYEILSYSKKFDHDIFDVPDVYEILHKVNHLDLLITFRFHGLIFATLTEVPFINLGLSRKTSLYCQENGLQDLTVEPYTFTFDRAWSALKNAEKPDVKERLHTLRLEKQRHLAEVTQRIQIEW